MALANADGQGRRRDRRNELAQVFTGTPKEIADAILANLGVDLAKKVSTELRRLLFPRTKKASPTLETAHRAIKALYPNGVPDRAAVRNIDLFEDVFCWCADQKLIRPRKDTVLRAAGRRR
jgi:hypothetical protein